MSDEKNYCIDVLFLFLFFYFVFWLIIYVKDLNHLPVVQNVKLTVEIMNIYN